MHLSLPTDPLKAGQELGEFVCHAARKIEVANRHNKHTYRQVMALAMTSMVGALIQDIGLDVLFESLRAAAKDVAGSANDEDKQS